MDPIRLKRPSIQLFSDSFFRVIFFIQIVFFSCMFFSNHFFLEMAHFSDSLFLACFFKKNFADNGNNFSHAFFIFLRRWKNLFSVFFALFFDFFLTRFFYRFYFLFHFLFLNSQIRLEIEKRFTDQKLDFVSPFLFFSHVHLLFYKNHFFATFLGNRMNFFRCFFGFFFRLYRNQTFFPFLKESDLAFFFTTFFCLLQESGFFSFASIVFFRHLGEIDFCCCFFCLFSFLCGFSFSFYAPFCLCSIPFIYCFF